MEVSGGTADEAAALLEDLLLLCAATCSTQQGSRFRGKLVLMTNCNFSLMCSSILDVTAGHFYLSLGSSEVRMLFTIMPTATFFFELSSFIW